MKKGIKMFILVGIIATITIAISIFAVHTFKVYMANKRAEDIIVGDNKKIENNNEIEPLSQTKIEYDDSIGTLTIPSILLENAPILESTELSTLSKGIGHFTNTNLYNGNIGLASHNSGESGDFFRNLKQIKLNDEIYYQTNYGTKRYTVIIKEIIDETDFSYLQETKENRITLITCVAGQQEKRLCIQAIENNDMLNSWQ